MKSISIGLFAVLTITACNETGVRETSAPVTEAARPAGVREEPVQYEWKGTTMNGFVYYDTATVEKRPAVLVIHEWWGVNDYAKMRARQLAGLGYVAMAVDIYGNGQQAQDPQAALSAAMPFYKEPAVAAGRLEAAMMKLRTYQQTDSTRIAAIGYCFGGTMALHGARLGLPLKAVASIHGDYPEGPMQKGSWTAPVFIAHGAADAMVPEAKLDIFRKQLDSLGVQHTEKVYPNATHAFSNPEATATGKKFNIPIAYNGAADTASWNDLQAFLRSHLK